MGGQRQEGVVFLLTKGDSEKGPIIFRQFAPQGIQNETPQMVVFSKFRRCFPPRLSTCPRPNRGMLRPPAPFLRVCAPRHTWEATLCPAIMEDDREVWKTAVLLKMSAVRFHDCCWKGGSHSPTNMHPTKTTLCSCRHGAWICPFCVACLGLIGQISRKALARGLGAEPSVTDSFAKTSLRRAVT